jgi:hypothetical protein
MKLKVGKSGNSLVLRITEWCRMRKVKKGGTLIIRTMFKEDKK